MRKRNSMLVFGEPAIGEEEITAVVATMRSKWVGTGPQVGAFQTAFADYVGARFAIATNSCTAALHLCMQASGIGPGDEVITSPMTFCATANAIIHSGAQPVFVDCDPRTLNIDPDCIEASITARTKAILPIHFAGRACDMDRIMALADSHGLAVFEDCAHAIESEWKGAHCGTFGKAGCFSFYTTKNLTTVEGGMIVTDDEAFADKLHVLSLHGMSKDAWKRFSDEGYVHYSVDACGYKYNMTDMQAAMGLCQLKKIDAFASRRRAIWDRYQQGLKDLPLFLPLDPEPETVHALHLYTPLLDLPHATITRDKLIEALFNLNVGAGVHYIALHRHKLYQELGCARVALTGAEFVSDRTFSIPLSPALSDDDVTDVITALHEILT